jgi:RsiW-degrading membrane proteinase PrsW (M82 family)
MREVFQFIFSSSFLLYAGVSLMPILGWIAISQRIHREKRSYVLLTFIAGMFSVLPIKLYEKYFGEAVLYFEHSNLFMYLGDLMHAPEFPKLFVYVFMNGLVAFAFFVFVALVLFLLEVLSGDNTIRVFQAKLSKIFETPFVFVIIGFFIGLAAYVFSTFGGNVQWFGFDVSQTVSFFLVVGMLEEYVKHLVLRFSDEEKIHTVDDAISFSIITALGFAFVENIMYLMNYTHANGFSLPHLGALFLLRSLVPVSAHISFSAITGYFYGISLFAHEIVREEIFRKKHSLLIQIHKVLNMKTSTLFYEEKMIEGLFLSMIVHTVFNLLLQFTNIFVVALFLVGCLILVFSFFHKIHYHRLVKNIVDPDLDAFDSSVPRPNSIDFVSK